MIHHQAPISGVATFGGKYVATAGYDNQIILWDGISHQPISRSWHDHLANQCRFSPCGQYLVSASSDYTARLWRLPDLKLSAVFSDHEDDVEMATFHPQGEFIATASRDHGVRIFTLEGKLYRDFAGHTADAISVEWSEDGNELISTSDDGTIKRWDAATGGLRDDIDMDGVETDTVVITPEGIIYAGNDNGEIITLTAGNTSRLTAHRSGVKRLIYDQPSRQLVSLSYDRALNLFRCLEEGRLELTHTAELLPIIWPRSCAFLNETTLVFGTFGTSYASYNIASGRWETSSIADTHGINAVTDGGGQVVTIGDAGIVKREGQVVTSLGSLCNFLLSFEGALITGGQLGKIFDAMTGEVYYQHRSPLNCAAQFRRNEQMYFIVGAYTGEGLVFSQNESGVIVFQCALPLHRNAVKGIACNDHQIFSVCATGEAAFHAIDGFRELSRIPHAHDRISNGCDALRDGRFVSVSRDRKLRIWATDVEVLPTPHQHSIKCVKTSSDGRCIATAAYDGRICVYDLERKLWNKTVRPTMAGISCLTAAKAGGFFASSYDGNVYRVAAQ